MRRAISLAKRAADLGEVPVGAVLAATPPPMTSPEQLHEGVMGEAHNQRETDQNPIAHAEVLALIQGARKTQSWRLTGCTLYVTLEPCLMCAGAILNSRISRVVFGAFDPKAGAVKTLFEVLDDSRLNHRCQTQGGVLESECRELLSSFFLHLRQKKKTSHLAD